jgi:hypothetical protein
MKCGKVTGLTQWIIGPSNQVRRDEILRTINNAIILISKILQYF